MPSTPWISLVSTVKDGTEVRAGVINPVFNQLVQRDQYLFEKFAESTDKSTLISFGVNVSTSAQSLLKQGSVVYFKNESPRAGLTPAQVAYVNTSITSSYFTPDSSSFVYGIVKSVYNDSSALKVADVWTSGRVTLDNNIDDAINGVLEPGETFAIGPLYLSRSYAGKLTYTPNGLAVFVAYACGQKQLLINPKVNELSQLFTQFNFSILDRPAGEPILTGTTWTIINADLDRVGWIPVADVPISKVPLSQIPAGSKFYYNIPDAIISTDPVVYENLDNPGISPEEKEEAKDLYLALPPSPPEYNSLYVNGVLQIQKNGADAADGIYLINNFGIWWFDDQDGKQPWASDIIDYPSWVPADWITEKGSDYLRSKTTVHFSKANPEFRSLTVTSLRPFEDATNITANALRVISSDTDSDGTAGDLLLKLDIGNSITTESPVTGTGVKTVAYNPLTGVLDIKTSPVVTSISAVGGISATTNPSTGQVTISSQVAGLSGQVLSLEPRGGTSLDYIGLHSFLRMKPAPVDNHSIVGKFQLPAVSPSTDLQLIVYLFGETSVSSATQLNLRFEYSITAPVSIIPTGSAISPLLTTGITTVSSVPIAFTNPYTARTCFSFPAVPPSGAVPTSLIVIPAAAICGNSVVNFKLTRLTSTYTGNIGIASIFWRFRDS